MRWEDKEWFPIPLNSWLQPLAAADFKAVAKSGEAAAMQSGGRVIWGRHRSVTVNFPSDTGEGWATDSPGLAISYLSHLMGCSLPPPASAHPTALWLSAPFAYQ